MIAKPLFWISIGIILYAYAGYTLILFFVVLIKKLFIPATTEPTVDEPDVTLFITAYNEEDNVVKKMENTLQLDYPGDKLKIVWITDGSEDNTTQLLTKYKEVTNFHENERKGKIHAMNRGMQYIKTPLVVFSDTNTSLNHEAIREIVKLFRDKKTGCVAGEKRIYMKNKDMAVSSGEGIYWQYESQIKKLESKLNSSMGAAGELFALRTSLFSPVKADTILDDFTISLNVARKGYKIKYTPLAYAEENASLNIHEEMKRKIRIASGGIQTLFRTLDVLNPFRYPLLSFQYFSHKVLRWTLVPVSFIAALITNILIVTKVPSSGHIFQYTLIIQGIFYFMVVIGWLLRNKQIRLKLVFLPYYLFIMNYSIIAGIIRFATNSHSVLWEKSDRLN